MVYADVPIEADNFLAPSNLSVRVGEGTSGSRGELQPSNHLNGVPEQLMRDSTIGQGLVCTPVVL
jgi:hypothetical protein